MGGEPLQERAVNTLVTPAECRHAQRSADDSARERRDHTVCTPEVWASLGKLSKVSVLPYWRSGANPCVSKTRMRDIGREVSSLCLLSSLPVQIPYFAISRVFEPDLQSEVSVLTDSSESCVPSEPGFAHHATVWPRALRGSIPGTRGER